MIDEMMEDRAMANIAAAREDAPANVEQIWADIRHDMQERGPFAAMLASFRREATEALAGLATCNPADAKEVARLQADVQRFISTMEIVHQFKAGAEEAEANFDTDYSLSTDDTEFTPTFED